MKISRILTLIVAGLVAFALFGLTYSATMEDGILRATSVGVLAGLLGFSSTVFTAWMFQGIEK